MNARDSTHEFYDHVTEKRIKLQALKDNSQIFVQSEEKVHPAPSEDNTASHTSHGHIGIAFKQKPPKYTISKPFSFEPRETAILEARSKREKLAYDHIRELANSFRAQPMPVGSPDPLPPRRSYTPTRPKPFRFKTDDRIINHSRRKEVIFSLK
ncbi:unnamed protein product [Protopolystoma xenopodis]|uniref:TPX2 C-terminal domain-containing protein n=1 Tax=Protopolystoma xenopodis TaxID=117903 RepID=A0A448WIY2_9PLAT|nr:unnamed protein product [Protopolystoma xenopodis]